MRVPATFKLLRRLLKETSLRRRAECNPSNCYSRFPSFPILWSFRFAFPSEKFLPEEFEHEKCNIVASMVADGHELNSAMSRQEGRSLTPALWTAGAASQAAAARILTKRGDGGLSMPLRAFSVASLILGAGFCASGATLWAIGIREVEDLRSMGRTVRTAFGKPPRTHA